MLMGSLLRKESSGTWDADGIALSESTHDLHGRTGDADADVGSLFLFLCNKMVYPAARISTTGAI
jgi:hypothetical protein